MDPDYFFVIMSPHLFSTPLGLGSQQTKDCQSSSLEFHHPWVRHGPRLSATEVSLSPPKVVASFRRQSEISLRFRALARFDGKVSVAGIFSFQGSRRSVNYPFTIRGKNRVLIRHFLKKSQNIFSRHIVCLNNSGLLHAFLLSNFACC